MGVFWVWNFLPRQKDPGEQPLCANPLRLECGGLGVARFKIHVVVVVLGKKFGNGAKKDVAISWLFWDGIGPLGG